MNINYKTITIFTLMLLFLVSAVNAVRFENMIPSDGSYFLENSGNIRLSYNITIDNSAQEGTNITAVNLFHDLGTLNGTYYLNQTITLGKATNQTTNSSGFLIALKSDGSSFKWYITVNTTNNSNSNLNFAESSRRLLYIERAPQIDLVSPASGSWQTTDTVNFTWRVNSTGTSNPYLQCRLYTNETEAFTLKGFTYIVNNNSDSSAQIEGYTGTTYQLNDSVRGIVWGIKCYENDASIFGFSANRSVLIDKNNPTITINAPSSHQYLNSGTVNISYTLTEVNAGRTYLILKNDSEGVYRFNATNTSTTTSGVYTFSLLVINGNYTVYLWQNDSADNVFNGSSSSASFVIDTTSPTINARYNLSVSGYALNWSFNVTANELVNITVLYGTTSDLSNKVEISSYATAHKLYVPFTQLTTETLYYINVTICDKAQNCLRDSSDGAAIGGRYYTPAPLYTGWTQYANYESTTLGTIANQSSADFVYVWNSTSKSWISHTYHAVDSGTNFIPNYGDVLHLYTASNSTWSRPISLNLTSYNTTFKQGDNWIGIPFGFTMANFTHAGSINAATYSAFNSSFEFYAGYNNTIQSYENHLYNFSVGNDTVLKPKNIESLWIYSTLNMTVLMVNASGGYIK